MILHVHLVYLCTVLGIYYYYYCYVYHLYAGYLQLSGETSSCVV